MREPWQLQYFKLAFLKMSIVTIWSVFPNPVTYSYQLVVSKLHIKHKIVRGIGKETYSANFEIRDFLILSGVCINQKISNSNFWAIGAFPMPSHNLWFSILYYAVTIRVQHLSEVRLLTRKIQ